jgi:hypothetical protein
MSSIAVRLANLAEGLTPEGVISAAKGGTGTTSGSAGGYISLSMAGAITPPFTGTARFYPPASITITKVLANLGAAPASGSLSFIIKKNGTSIGTTFTLSSVLMTPVTVNVPLTATDYLTLDISGSAATDLSVKLQYS